MLTDSHCHVTCDELYGNKEDILQRAFDAGVDQMLIICTNPKEYERAAELKKDYPDQIRVAFGYYPGDAKDVSQEDFAILEEACRSGNVDVLGEIGLDYHWDTSFKDIQKDLFIRQLQLAEECHLPVSIHMRDASRDTMDLLHAYARTPIIFHCFSGSAEIMKEALKMDSMISFAGPITYKNNRQGVENVRLCPADRLLSETDSPYLSPVPYRGKRNEPAYVKATEEKMAEIKEMDPQELARQIRTNYLSLFQPRTEIQS